MDSPLIETFLKTSGHDIYRLMHNPEKNARIRERRKETLLRRKHQEAKTYELKLDKSRISKGKLTTLQRLFLEGKWFINYVIANGITSFEAHKDYKVDSVAVKVGDKLEERKLTVLSSQMKQALIKRLQ
ncbi:MAG: hypothetical protein ACP5LX_07100, partial [Nitrososphaeria archaeon]